jgi:DNA-directed RNA polymerase subunit RPC12/RpoP
MKKPLLLLAAGAVVLIAQAGSIIDYQCSGKDCDFKGESYLRTGRATTKINGYCVECKKMVTASYANSQLKDGKIPPLARIWDAASGKTLDLYECPHCKKPFAEITSLVYCPKCGQKTITQTGGGKWD